MSRKVTIIEEIPSIYDIIWEDVDPYEQFIDHLINITAYPKLNIKNEQGQTILHVAASPRKGRRLRMSFLNGVCPCAKNVFGNTVLHGICEEGDLRLAVALLHPLVPEEMIGKNQKKYKSSYRQSFRCLNLYNKSGLTALHIAVSFNHLQLTRMLLEYGANINAKTSQDHYTPLHLAVKNNNEKMVPLLLKWDSNVYARTLSGISVYEMSWPRNQLLAILIKNAETIWDSKLPRYKSSKYSQKSTWT